ncbi:MAG: hypothetical protein E6J27_13670 [Chloroflexi bacterium]|nr:MAG: hypothetical protein E6J27_13670 [Chloroflexota bacterium]
MARRWAVVLAGVLVACAPRGLATATPGASASAELGSAEPTASPSATSALRLAITDSAYGSLAIQTSPGASCSVDIVVVATSFGEAPPPTLAAQTVPQTGVLRWTYAAPRIPNSNGAHWVTCQNAVGMARESKGFAVARPPMIASGLAVHVTTNPAPRDNERPDPSLVPLRDAALAKMRATLATEWKKATRGLGALQIVDTSADISIFVVAARGTSVYRTSADGSNDIVVYVSDPKFGPETTDNLVATALHELGHIWCCSGPDAGPDGHWLQLVRDPGLYGVDKYGLMTHPVTCISFGALLSCPNRFSDREMRALGFSSFPPPAADPCVTQGIALSRELSSVEAQLAASRAQIDADKSTLAQLTSQIRALEAEYPSGMPPTPYAQYQSLIAQYNKLVQDDNARVDGYNALVAHDQALVQQVNALLCDWT